MAYGEYKDSGRCLGKILYQLSKIGIPLHIVERVILEKEGELKYGEYCFATYIWNEQDTPVFQFSTPYYHFGHLKQEPIVIGQMTLEEQVNLLKAKFSK